MINLGNAEKIGRKFTSGALQEISRLVILILVFYAIAVYTPIGDWVTPRDSTDAPSGDRSGMELYVDHLTKCHYLSTAYGDLTPRMNKDGEQVCQ